MPDQALSPFAGGTPLALVHGVQAMISNGASAICEPLYVNASGQASPAFAAGTLQQARCVGLAAVPTPNGGYVPVQYKGILEATHAQWDAVVTGESGGLTPGANYFVSTVNPGKLVTSITATSGQFVSPVGVALSSTQMLILIDQPILAQDE